MSMGTFCHFADTIDKEHLAKIAGKKAVNAFVKAFDNYKFAEGDTEDCTELAQTVSGYDDYSYDFDTDRKEYKALEKKWKVIADAVKKETGLDLICDYHASEDSYDEVDGLFFGFYTSDLYQPTPKFKALRNKFGVGVVDRCFWTTFG